jgi:glycosyltransferase involved in cell wall biosynthesis
LDKPSAWWGHVPFAFWIIATCRPRLLVELGTSEGVSYAAFCDAVARLRAETRCYAVDTWPNDADAGFHGDDIYNELREFHDKRYASFSELLRMDVDDASRSFDDGTVDLLHIHGDRAYEAARRSFEMWRPKLSKRAVVLFHHTNVRKDDFGVWRLFDELKKELPSFEFLHGGGLGVALVGVEAPIAIRELCGLAQNRDIAAVRERFSHFGTRWMAVADENMKNVELAPLQRNLEEAVTQKDAQIGQSDGVLSFTNENVKELAASLRQLEDSVARKDAQIAEYLYHLNRINASPYWRLGMWFSRLVQTPVRTIKRQSANLVASEISGSVKPRIWTGNSNANRDTILVLAHEASRTGAPILAWNLVCEFSKRYNVVVLLRRGGAIQKAFEEVAAAVVCLPDDLPMLGHELESVVNRLVKDYSPIYAIANSVETRHFVPDLEKMGVPVVALVHEFSCYCWPVGTLNTLYQTASKIVFSAGLVAENSVKDYRSLDVRDFKILPQGQSKLPPGTDSSMTAVVTKTDVKGLWPKDSEDSLLVVGMGTIQIRKGIEFFISTAAIVHRAMPNRELRFAWVGKCYPHEEFYFNFLKQQVERSGLSDTFAFVEEVDDLQPIYDQADIYFLSSRLDPLPNVAIDSALNGIPVVCFEQASGMPEILVASEATRGLVVPHLDTGAAALLICDLAENPARLESLSKAIRGVAEAHFNMARYVEALDELGLGAKTGLDQAKRDHALISKHDTFNADLYLGASANKFAAGEVLTKYLNVSRLVAPRRRPRAGLFLRRPLEGFHPLIYAEDNPQYDEATGEDPLAHYIRTGEPAGRWKHEVVLPGVGRASAGTALSVAVHGHFHYPELLPDFIKRLKSNAAVVDFYVTTTSAAKATEITKFFAASGIERAKIIVVPNRGRDTGPMLTELSDRVLSGYDIVGHFHGKRSPQFEAQFGDRWRNFLWEHLVGGEFAMMDVVLEAFAKDEGLGLVFAEDPHLIDWDENWTSANELAQRMGLALPLPNHFDFPMGGMFWARTAALKPLFDLALAWDDYPDEPLPTDGTILHAIERLLPFCADKAGYRYATTYVKSWTR